MPTKMTGVADTDEKIIDFSLRSNQTNSDSLERLYMQKKIHLFKIDQTLKDSNLLLKVRNELSASDLEG